MSIQIFESIYNGSRLTRAQTILAFEAIDGTITDISINAPNTPSTGDYIFNVQKNGTNLFSGGSRFTINAANKRVEKNALEIETDEADVLTITLEAVGQAGLLAPVFVIFTIDDGVEVETDIAFEVHAATAKTTPVNSDEIGIVDSAASNILKKLSFTNLKAFLKTYFDTLYQAVLVSGTNIKTINGTSVLGSGDMSISGGVSDLDDLSDVALTSPTTGQVLKFNGTNWVNGTDNTGSGGGSANYGASFPADQPPSSPSPMDDEFTSDTDTNALWTITTGTGITYSVSDEKTPSRLVVDWGTSNAALEMRQAFAPGSADFSFTLKTEAQSVAQFQGLFFLVSDSGESNMIRMAQYFINSSGREGLQLTELNPFSHMNTFDTSPVPYRGAPMLIHLQRVSGTYSMWYSVNGVQWTQLATSGKSFTVAKIILKLEQAGSTTKGKFAMDWIRKDYLFLS